jgi:hypothetical protein
MPARHLASTCPQTRSCTSWLCPAESGLMRSGDFYCLLNGVCQLGGQPRRPTSPAITSTTPERRMSINRRLSPGNTSSRTAAKIVPWGVVMVGIAGPIAKQKRTGRRSAPRSDRCLDTSRSVQCEIVPIAAARSLSAFRPADQRSVAHGGAMALCGRTSRWRCAAVREGATMPESPSPTCQLKKRDALTDTEVLQAAARRRRDPHAIKACD